MYFKCEKLCGASSGNGIVSHPTRQSCNTWPLRAATLSALISLIVFQEKFWLAMKTESVLKNTRVQTQSPQTEIGYHSPGAKHWYLPRQICTSHLWPDACSLAWCHSGWELIRAQCSFAFYIQTMAHLLEFKEPVRAGSPSSCHKTLKHKRKRRTAGLLCSTTVHVGHLSCSNQDLTLHPMKPCAPKA